jgi:hypothetical protein
MNGIGGGLFDPEGKVTVAEAITMGCRIHNQAKGGKDADRMLFRLCRTQYRQVG